MKRFAIVLVGLLTACSIAAAAGKDRYAAIDKMLADVAMGQLSLMGAADGAAVSGESRKTKAQLDGDLDKALAAAKGKPDLLKATKEFYIAATSYFESAYYSDIFGRAKAERAQAAMEEKQKALEIELKLVGG